MPNNKKAIQVVLGLVIFGLILSYGVLYSINPLFRGTGAALLCFCVIALAFFGCNVFLRKKMKTHTVYFTGTILIGMIAVVAFGFMRALLSL